MFFKKDSKTVFWKWFHKNSSQYFSFERDQDSLFDQLKNELNKIDSNLVFEFSPILQDGKRNFVISADGIKSSFSSVIDLVESAPRMQAWNIIAFRQPKPITDTFQFSNINVKFSDIYFTAITDKNRLGLDMYIKDYEESAEWTTLTYLLLDYILGEYDTELYISWIEKHTLKSKENLIPISDLFRVVNQHKMIVLN